MLLCIDSRVSLLPACSLSEDVEFALDNFSDESDLPCLFGRKPVVEVLVTAVDETKYELTLLFFRWPPVTPRQWCELPHVELQYELLNRFGFQEQLLQLFRSPLAYRDRDLVLPARVDQEPRVGRTDAFGAVKQHERRSRSTSTEDDPSNRRGKHCRDEIAQGQGGVDFPSTTVDDEIDGFGRIELQRHESLPYVTRRNIVDRSS